MPLCLTTFIRLAVTLSLLLLAHLLTSAVCVRVCVCANMACLIIALAVDICHPPPFLLLLPSLLAHSLTHSYPGHPQAADRIKN